MGGFLDDLGTPKSSKTEFVLKPMDLGVPHLRKPLCMCMYIYIYTQTSISISISLSVYIYIDRYIV